MSYAITGDLHSSIQGQQGGDGDGNSYSGTRSFLCDSISLDFESDVVALGTSNTSTYQGKVELSYWNNTTKYWNHGSGSANAVAQTLNGNLTGTSTNVKFGHDVSLDWDGTRIAVGAPGVNKVMVFDATGTGTNKWSSYVSNTLATPSISGSAEFGYSVSLSQSAGDVIAVGAPGIDTVYIYEFNVANAPNEWGTSPVRTIQGSNSPTSGNNTQLKNVVPSAIDSDNAYTNYLWCHGIINRFGHKVRLTHFGNYLVIGAPGVHDSTLNSTNTYTTIGGTTGISFTTSNQGQLGHVRVYKIPDDDDESWGGSNFTQHGQTLQGHSVRVTNSSTASTQPEFGTSCDIAWNGSKVVIGSPYFSTASSGTLGQVKTYIYDSDDTTQYIEAFNTIVGNRGGNKLGMNVRLDYESNRLVTGRLQMADQESEFYSGGSLSVFDWANDRWYELTAPLRLEDWPSYTDRIKNPCEITKGDIVCIANPAWPAGNTENLNGSKGEVRFYKFGITESVQGNQVVGGHIKVESLFVGANDNSSNVSQGKRIAFGGTNMDNAYNQTFIENRAIDTSGRSELLIFKKNDIEENNQNETDSIRIKTAEFRLDYHNGEHGGGDEPETQRTRLYMNRGGQVAVGNAFYNGNFDVVSDFDVNDKSFFWTTVNIGNKTNKPLGTTPALNTNSERIFAGGATTATPIGIDGKYGSQQFERYNTGSQAWDSDEFAFYFSQSNATIYENTHPGNWHNAEGQFSCWIKLNDTQSNCAGVLAWFGEDHHRESVNANWTQYKGGWLKLTSTGLQYEFEHNSANVQSISYTFNQDAWYHIAGNFPSENTYPGAYSGKSWPKIFIDGVEKTLSSYPGSAYNGGVEWDNAQYGFGSAFTYSRKTASDVASDGGNVGDIKFSGEIATISSTKNNGIKNCWIALMDIGSGDTNTNLSKIMPGEMLTVGGICTITKYLGVGVPLPKYQIDVKGTISSNVVLAGGSSVESTPYYFTVTVNGSSKFVINGTQQPPITLYRGVTYRFDQADSSNGSHPFRISTTAEGSQYASGSSYNGSNGSSGAYRQFIVPLDAPDTMYYNCSSHSSMGNTLRILSGIVTTSGVASSNVFINNHMGIGIQTPKGPLHIYESTGSSHIATSGTLVLEHGDSGGSSCIVFPSKKNYGSDYGYIQYEDSTSGTNEKSRLIFGIENDAAGSNEDNIILSPTASVGIGTDTPTYAKLVVNGSAAPVDLSYGWLNSSGNTGTSSGTNSYSIYTNQRIASAEFNAHSDSRIKKNVVDINDSSALDKIRLLEPKIYNYIDEKQRGTSNVYGFIAQEVSNVLPYAVTVSTGDIPNILTNSNVSVTSDSNVLELRLDTAVEGLTLSNTSNINITTDKNKYLTVPVLTFSGSNVITIQNSDTFSNVTGAYIHGEQVSNFHHLNKDAIWAVSTAALQEVDRQLQAEKTKVTTLQTQVADLLTRVTALENN